MIQIIPAILTPNFNEFKQILNRLKELFPIVQIDVMDGAFVKNKSFEEIDQVKKIKTDIKYELHLMVEHPLQEMEKWADNPNIHRVIFHTESKDNIEKCLAYAHGRCWQTGLAVNPETSVEKIQPYLEKINEVLFLTVHPGHQGAPLIPEVKEKIKEFVKIPSHPLCAVDGGVNQTNILELKKIGVDIFYIGGTLVHADDIRETYEELKNIID